jgi:hypothetical protein
MKKKNIYLLILVFLHSCIIEKVYTIDPTESTTHVFKLENTDQYVQNLIDNKLQIRDSLLIFELSKCLGDNLDYYLNYFVYYLISQDNKGRIDIIRTDDYSTREYLVFMNNLKSISHCIEVAAEKGDGANYYYKFSEMKNDSLITYSITETYILDETADTILNVPPIIDTTIDIRVLKINE